MFCSSLKKIHLPSSMRKVGTMAFYDSGSRALYVEIPAKAKWFGADALRCVTKISIYGLPYLLVLPCRRTYFIERNLNQLLGSLHSPNDLDRFLDSNYTCWGEWSVPVLCYALSVFSDAPKLAERTALWAEQLGELFCHDSDGETVMRTLLSRDALPQAATERLLAQLARTRRSDLTALLMEYKNRRFGFRSVESTDEDDLL